MITKHLKRKLKLNKESDSLYNIPMELEYYLIESKLDYTDDLSGEKVYGIGIVKRISETSFEENIVHNFSCCINETSELIDKMADNTVTPVSLRTILDDLLGT